VNVLRVALLVLILLANSALAHAQAKDRFVQGLIEFVSAAEGTHGDEGQSLLNAIQTMNEGLAEWDASVAGVEAGLASEIGGAPRPMAARMRATLAAVYLERGRIDAALAQFAQAVELDASLAGIDALRALALDRAGRSVEAARSYRRAWQLDPENPLYAYSVLRSSGATGPDSPDFIAASKTLRAAVQRASKTAGDPPAFATVDLVDDASVPAPIFPLSAYADAFALVRQARYDEAIAGFRAVAMSDPLVTDPALRASDLSDAIAALKRSNTPSALAALAAATSRHPDSAEAHRILGVAYMAASQYDKSLEHLRTAARLNSRDERSRLAIADALVALNDLSQARDLSDQTVRAFPRSGQARWTLGTLHRRFGDEANALQSFEAAAGLSPFAGFTHVLTAIGTLQRNQLNFEAAVTAYSRAVSAAPNNSQAHYELGEALHAQDQLDRALGEFLVAAVLDPSSAKAFAMIGQIDAAAARDEAAVEMLQRAVSLDSEHREAHYALSRALLRVNRPEDAQRELAIFQKLQAKAMEEERQRFQDNLRKIEETLKSGDAKGQAR
jgi:tetratricopeptide (TPR) repeat protein